MEPQPPTPDRPSDAARSGVRGQNLPVPPTSFVGREREMVQVESLLEGADLLTLVGPGGTGKTRLALAVAEQLAQRYGAGARLVELAAITDGAFVPHATAAALGLRLPADRPAIDGLTEALRNSELLLVLDNCEHLIEATARLAKTLLEASAELRILATSREPLGVPGELSWQVPPLPVPDGTVRDVENLAGYEAVRLFVERARHHLPGWSLSGTDAELAAEICRRLGGLPLAIELAAARVRDLSMQQIAANLSEPMHLLVGGDPAIPRQRTMRATLDWGYNLLSGAEQALLRRASVFAGGWTLEAAEKVGAGDDVVTIQVSDLVLRLEDKSLVLARVESEGGLRYSMLEPIRRYALERLEEVEDAEAVWRRHYDYYLALAEAAESELTGPRQVEWLDRLEREHDNLRAALTWALRAGERHDYGLQLRLAGALWRFWDMHGHQREAARWLSTGLSKDGHVSPSIRAKALSAAGMLAWQQGDYGKAARMHGESLALRRQLGDRRGVASSLNHLGLVKLEQEEYDEASALFQESLRLRREMDDGWGEAVSLNNLGLVALQRQEYDRARAAFEASLALRRELNNQQGIANSLNNLGLVAYFERDYERARALLGEGLALRRALGDTLGVASLLSSLGRVALAQGEYEQAAALWREALAKYWQVRARTGIVLSLEGLSIAAARQHPARAVRLWAAAEALRENRGRLGAGIHHLDTDEQFMEEARSRLGQQAFEAAWRAGRSMTGGEAVEYALSGTLT